MDLPHGRKPERVGEGKIQQDRIEAALVDVCKPIGQGFRMGNFKLFDAPFRKQILRQTRIDVIVFDQEHRNHLYAPCGSEMGSARMEDRDVARIILEPIHKSIIAKER